MTETDSRDLSLKWVELNDKDGDHRRMTKEASKCLDNKQCGCCKRIDFVLRHCQHIIIKKKTYNLTMNVTDDALSTFMNGLKGYSHIQLSKDFRHLQIYHSIKSKDVGPNRSERDQNVDYSDTKSLLKHTYNSLSKYDLNMNPKKKK